MKNRKKTSVILISIFILLVFTNYSFVKIENSQQKEELENSLLWEISGNGLESPSYLFGTIHLIPKKDYFFTNTMKEKFKSCKTLALEIDINMPLSEQIKIAKKIIFPAGKTLKDYMSDEEFSNLQNFILDTLKIKESKFKQVQKIQPFYGSAIILNELLGKTEAYEKKLNKAAKKKKMTITALETIEYQMSIIEKISIEEQVKMMYVEGFDENPLAEFNKLLDAYKTQDLKALRELMLKENDIANFEQDFLITRNQNWIPKIKELAKQQSTFIAVGAGHLVGETGLIALLRAEGFVVKAVK
ncbi:MAG: TraB/GumN family protein [Saprospiraceae bacterium]|nr:TraB/GumN family protein [Saprospiraceae bacterium]